MEKYIVLLETNHGNVYAIVVEAKSFGEAEAQGKLFPSIKKIAQITIMA